MADFLLAHLQDSRQQKSSRSLTSTTITYRSTVAIQLASFSNTGSQTRRRRHAIPDFTAAVLLLATVNTSHWHYAWSPQFGSAAAADDACS